MLGGLIFVVGLVTLNPIVIIIGALLYLGEQY